ncbi:MAG: DUF2752 domain-containing protein [Alphaproteobacteria bacterium]|nr:DUF2752 domain-containing protein [Alphaproteobacteria bacterium]
MKLNGIFTPFQIYTHSRNRNTLYATLFTSCMAGYIWLFVVVSTFNKQPLELCIIKRITHLPCLACGSTKSVISLSQGNLFEAFKTNPLGYLIALIMVISPLWIAFDILTKNKTYLTCFQKLETHVKKTQYAIPLVILVIINWVWNITKGV